MKTFLLLLFISLNVFAANRQDIKSNIVGVGQNDSADKILEFNAASGTARMKFRANYGASTLQYTNDGVIYKDFGSANPAYTYSLITTSQTAVIGSYTEASGTIQVTLPTAAGSSGKIITIANVSTSGTAVVSLTTTSSQLIGASSSTIIGKEESLTLMSDGSNWRYFPRDQAIRKIYVRIGGSSLTSACTSSPCTPYLQQGPISSITRSAAGDYTTNFPNGTFSLEPSCVCSSNSLSNLPCDAATLSATQVRTTTTIGQTGAQAESITHLTCWGPM